MTIEEGEENRDSIDKPQSRASKLAEYITGFRLEDPRIIDRMEEDQKKTRAKYGLPDKNWVKEHPTEYEKFLRNILEKYEIRTRETSDLGDYGKEHGYSDAAYFDKEKQIGVNINRDDASSYINSLFSLEHETIHLLQDKKTPRMPIEVQEYEAYIASGDAAGLRSDPEMLEAFFSVLVAGSFRHWYATDGKERGLDTPEWDK